MRRFVISLIALFLVAIPPPADAARKLREIQPTTQELRLIVLTAPGCIYCRLFQSNIEPTFKNSTHGKSIPLVYIDINDAAADKLKLVAPVRIVPTVLLVEGNREVSRISGYISPTDFFKAFKLMLVRR